MALKSSTGISISEPEPRTTARRRLRQLAAAFMIIVREFSMCPAHACRQRAYRASIPINSPRYPILRRCRGQGVVRYLSHSAIMAVSRKDQPRPAIGQVAASAQAGEAPHAGRGEAAMPTRTLGAIIALVTFLLPQSGQTMSPAA